MLLKSSCLDLVTLLFMKISNRVSCGDIENYGFKGLHLKNEIIDCLMGAWPHGLNLIIPINL